MTRLINYFYPHKDRIQARTYGTSRIQNKSYEIFIAKEFCKRLNIKWDQIRLDSFLDNEFLIIGINYMAHLFYAHGMYHIEFLKKLEKRYPRLQ